MGGKGRAPDYGPLAAAQRYAADLQYKAAQENIASWEKFNAQQREDFRPFREHGLDVLAEIQDGLKSGKWDQPAWDGTKFVLPKWTGGTEIPEWEGYETELPEFDPESVDLESDPGYQFRLSEGLKQIRRAASAGSGSQTGATAKALQRFAQGTASNEYAAARGRAIQDYLFARQEAQDQQAIEREEYDITRLNALQTRQNEVQDFGINTQRVHDTRNQSLQEWLTRQQTLDNQFSRLAGQLGIGLSATGQTASLGAQATGQQTMYNAQGAAARGAGEIGAATSMIQQQLDRNRARQQSFNNLMSIAGLGARIAGIPGVI